MTPISFSEIELKLPPIWSEAFIKSQISKKLRVRNFSYQIIKQSVDARKKPDVFLQTTVRVFSNEIKGSPFVSPPNLDIFYRKKNKKVVVVGSGPAGFFAGFVLQKAGYDVTIVEKGPQVKQRWQDVTSFEKGISSFKDQSNYCHGEGGAGTFSDGKLTSRTKGIAVEKAFVYETYISGGAPEEIRYLSKPHIGSDNLRKIIPNLRRQFENLGGTMLFNTKIVKLDIKDNRCVGVFSENDFFTCNYLIVAPGHSSYDTFRLLHQNHIGFRTKSFALGVRVEHPQELINQSQWGNARLHGLKAADYKLTFTASNKLPVYSFCMCPGGMVVPSAPVEGQNIVNGVSNYARNNPFANSAIVVGINLNELLEKEMNFEDTLKWMENLERKVFEISGGYNIPGNNIDDFLRDKVVAKIPDNSFPFEVFPYDFRALFPKPIIIALKESLHNFAHKIKGFETGLMMGLESKTSAPVQVLRDNYRRCFGFSNIFIAGEGSGYAGGIISSAVDGVKTAMGIIEAE
jgi:uncharacterized protein